MRLIVYYLIFIIVGDFADYFIGLGVEYLWPGATQLSLVVFLSLYFLVLWLGWVLAVRLTKSTVEKTKHV
jgi:hypothetical protein